MTHVRCRFILLLNYNIFGIYIYHSKLIQFQKAALFHFRKKGGIIGRTIFFRTISFRSTFIERKESQILLIRFCSSQKGKRNYRRAVSFSLWRSIECQIHRIESSPHRARSFSSRPSIVSHGPAKIRGSGSTLEICKESNRLDRGRTEGRKVTRLKIDRIRYGAGRTGQSRSSR